MEIIAITTSISTKVSPEILLSCLCFSENFISIFLFYFRVWPTGAEQPSCFGPVIEEISFRAYCSSHSNANEYTKIAIVATGNYMSQVKSDVFLNLIMKYPAWPILREVFYMWKLIDSKWKGYFSSRLSVAKSPEELEQKSCENFAKMLLKNWFTF